MRLYQIFRRLSVLSPLVSFFILSVYSRSKLDQVDIEIILKSTPGRPD